MALCAGPHRAVRVAPAGCALASAQRGPTPPDLDENAVLHAESQASSAQLFAGTASTWAFVDARFSPANYLRAKRLFRTAWPRFRAAHGPPSRTAHLSRTEPGHAALHPRPRSPGRRGTGPPAEPPEGTACRWPPLPNAIRSAYRPAKATSPDTRLALTP